MLLNSVHYVTYYPREVERVLVPWTLITVVYRLYESRLCLEIDIGFPSTIFRMCCVFFMYFRLV